LFYINLYKLKEVKMQTALDRAKRLSAVMRAALVIILIAIMCLAIYLSTTMFTQADSLSNWLAAQAGLTERFVIGTGQRTAFLALVLVQIAVLMGALNALRLMFGSIVADEALSQATARHMRTAGLYFAASAVFNFASHPLYSLLATLNAPPGQRMISIGVGTAELLSFLLAAVLIVLGHIQLLAAEISDDNRQIV
jgi:hypothetical protein